MRRCRLAALEGSADCRMVSFDAKFAQYRKVGQSQDVGLDFLHLRPELDIQR